MRHDNIRDLLTNLLEKVCKDVESEPHLQKVTSEVMDHQTANTEDDSRLDIKARNFWQRGQTAFFDIRVTNVNAESQKNQTTLQVFRNHELAKRSEYLQGIVDIENGSFIPLVFGTNGGVGKECEIFLSTLAQKLSIKTGDEYAETMTWLRRRLSMETVRSAVTCVRGSRTPFKVKPQEFTDFYLMNLEST